MVANALYLPAWLAGCSSHQWVSRISLILWIYCSAAIALAIWPDKKDKSYVCPSKSFWPLVLSSILFYIVFSLFGVMYYDNIEHLVQITQMDQNQKVQMVAMLELMLFLH